MGTRKLLSGNVAIALGAWEAGVGVGGGYRGTPSTEILEALFTHPDVYCEWSINEKVALEVGLGASIAGARALVTMKHVGVNVAADPLFTSAYTGVNGGLVVITADDPSMHSSQNEQDNRHYAIAAKIPLLEPADSAEARAFTRMAFEMSETFDTPVLLRTTTRLSHAKGVVDDVDLTRTPARHPLGIERDPAKYVMIPGNARRRRLVVETHLDALREASETHPSHRVEERSREVGVITAGVPYSYVREVLPDASVLKLGLVHPLPRRLIEEFVAAHDEVFVVEELDPVIETQVLAWGLAVRGKDVLPSIGEFNPDILRASLGLASPGALPGDAAPGVTVPARLPQLCTGCPHGHVFSVLKARGVVVSGDIGCYTLGVLPPYNVLDTCVDMGASITMAHGMDAALAGMPGRPRIAAVIGDSTFAHSGITGLVNAVWNGRSGLYIVLDNGTTAMTGSQPNPLSGERMGRENAPALDYRLLARAIGIPDANIAVVDGNSLAAVTTAVDDLLDRDGVRLLAAVGLCVIEAKELRKVGKLDEKRAWRALEVTPVTPAEVGAHA